MKLTELKPNPNNPRLIKDDKFKKLVKSLQEFPEMMEKRPMVCVTDADGKKYPLGGNMRLKALQELKYKEIPETWVTMADEWTEEKRQEFVIKDNVGFGEWDWEVLNVDWDLEQLADWGLDVPELEEETPEAVEDDYEIPDEIQTDIVLGDIFELSSNGLTHRLLCGDSTDSDSVAKLMNGEKADIMVTDPPYNVAYEGKTKDAMTIQNDKMSNSDFKSFLDSFFSCSLIELKEGAPIYVFCPIEDGAFLNAFLNSGFKLQSILIWLKNTIVMGRKDYNYKHEPILYGWKEGAAHKWYGSFDKSTIIECNKPPRNGEHPTMKPIELLETVLNNSSQSNDLVLDLFLGSGSTMVASHQLNRKCYGMELDPKYCAVIVDRMKKLDPDLVIKKNGKIIE